MSVSTLTKVTVLILFSLVLQACQLPYLATGAYEQVKILNSRKAVKKVITNKDVKPETKEKLEFALLAQDYASKKGLNCKGNFKSFVQLNRPYVTYLVIASKKHELKAKTWWFPIVGSFPYKGYFSEQKAKKAALKLQKNDYDTFVRGVSAYSSLGWFKEPILSSMLHGSKYDLADTIFHECFHGTVFYKNDVEKNERLAVFFAHKILIEFLIENDLKDKTKLLDQAWMDQILFSKFLSKSIKKADLSFSKGEKQKTILNEIQTSYKEKLKPKLKALNFDSVFLKDLNNAKIVAYKTYFHDFKTLEDRYEKEFKKDIFSFLEHLKKKR